MTLAKADQHGAAEVDFGTERPHYRALALAINYYYADLLRPLAKLRLRVFGALQRVPKEKEEGGDEEAFSVTYQKLRAIDGALDDFLEAVAGRDRTLAGFVAGDQGAAPRDGIIQQRNLFSYAVGIGRAQDQVGGGGNLTADRKSPGVERMLTDAFERLSENGRLRLEGIRDDVHEVLANGMQAGLSPTEVGRQLTRLFDEVGGYDFQRLARTESAFASVAGQQDQYRALGIERIGFLISADACAICQGYDGKEDAVDGDLPPWHP